MFLVDTSAGDRRALEIWFDEHAIHPEIVAEMDDLWLLLELGAAGEGLFLGPSILEDEIRRRYAVSVVGRLPDLREQFYAIAGDRRIEHPAVAVICAAAREGLERGVHPELTNGACS